MGGAVGRPKYMGQLLDGKRHGQVWRCHTRAVCKASCSLFNHALPAHTPRVGGAAGTHALEGRPKV